jgi:trehalose 6-phosphate synthase/phosphatase
MKKQIAKRLVIVANRLPFTLSVVDKKLTMKESDGGLVSALKSYFDSTSGQCAFESVTWIGSAEFSRKRWEKFQRKKNTLNYKIAPIFIDRKKYSSFYNGFCNATLWPLFHYFPSIVEFDSETFSQYQDVNQIFATELLSMLQADDILWVHDYQLMLLPGMIRKHRPDATIGFFLHIPFPSFEIFRMLHRPWKDQIVNGLLGADLIGFHTHEYVQHFLKTMQMITGHDYQFRSVFLPDRVIKAEMFPLGIDFEKFSDGSESPGAVSLADSIRSNFEGMKIIFSVDRLDYTKGINHRLQGFERFLEKNPEWKERVVFILTVVPSRQVVSKYRERKKMIEEEIGRINGKFSTLRWQPLIYRYNHMGFEELCAMYRCADVGLITPLRDGMNLVAKEFIATKRHAGVLILSELAGASNELGEAIIVNPLDAEEVSSAIGIALNMPEKIQEAKIANMQARLKSYSVVHWMDDFLRQLDEVKTIQHSKNSRYLSGRNKADLVRHYAHSERRMLLLDYDGTLVPFASDPKLAVPDQHLRQILLELSRQAGTDVAIISGRDQSSLERWLGDIPMFLVAEHGASIRGQDGTWENFLPMDHTWKQPFRPVLDLYVQRSPGAFVEEKSHTLVWHYRNVNKELGFIRSRELLDNLHHMIRNSAYNIIDGNKVIEIRMAEIDKGVVARKLVAQGKHDLIIAIGDDKTDEDMFRALSDTAYTVKIGSGHTQARNYLSTQREVLALLDLLVHTTLEQPVLINP